MSSDSDYVCTLDQASIKKAKAELNENPEDRLAAVQALKDWIQEQPHIKCPRLDTVTLLMYLRGAKFSQLKAREKFEESLLLKQKYPKWFLDIDTYDPVVKAVVESGYILPLPKRSAEGCQIFLCRLEPLGELLGPQKMTMSDTRKMSVPLLEWLHKSEMTQVNGSVYIVDFQGLKASLLTKFMTKENGEAKKAMQNAISGRFKAFHYYRAGLFFETLMNFYRPFISKKWMDRIIQHDTLETLYKSVPMECLPEEYLPDEYEGPNAGTIEQIAKKFAEEISSKEFHDEVLYKTSKAFWLDPSKRPTEKVTEHFRKLTVD